jgi:hypothetical protein
MTTTETYDGSALANELLRRIGQAVGDKADVSAVFGEPVEREGITVIPVAKARFAFGGGAGAHERESSGGGGGGADQRARSATSRYTMAPRSSSGSPTRSTCSRSLPRRRSQHSPSSDYLPDNEGLETLVVHVPEGRFVIEQAPAWSSGAERGVVAEGPVGARAASRFRLFRYEVRRWRHGVIPDIAEAVESPRRLSGDIERARRARPRLASRDRIARRRRAAHLLRRADAPPTDSQLNRGEARAR